MIPVTLRHHFDFGPSRTLVGDALSDASSWDALRLNGGSGFRIASDRAEHERQAAQHGEIRDRMATFAEWLTRNRIRSLASYGAGTALPEYWLRCLLPDLTLTLTEAGPETYARLTQLFPEDCVVQHDLITDAPVPGDVHLFHRIDTEFSNAQWRALLSRFADQQIILMATETLSLRRTLIEIVRALQPGTTAAGWVRNRAAFESLLGTTHDVAELPVGDLPTWLLTPRMAGAPLVAGP
jgi:hypothetical protein